MAKRQQRGNKESGAEAESKKHHRPGGIHMQFLLGFGYQFASIVLIGLAFIALAYFATEKNWKAVIWSLFAVWCLVGLLAAIYAHQHYFPLKLEETPPVPEKQAVSREDVDDIKRQLADLYRHVKPPAEHVVEKYPGLSLQGVISLHALQENRRKYLFDFGHPDKSRFSIYFDPSNVLTLALVSEDSEPYNVRVPSREVPLDQFFYLSCEVAIGGNSTSLRILINGNQVGTLDLPFRIDAGSLDPVGGVVGADLNGNNGARFDVAEVMLYSTTLTSDEVKGLLQYFSSNPRTKFVQFSGTQWMRNLGSGKGLHQELPEAKPIFRDLDTPPPNNSNNPPKSN